MTEQPTGDNIFQFSCGAYIFGEKMAIPKRTLSRTKSFRSKLAKTLKFYFGWDDFFAILIGVFGALYYFGGPFTNIPVVNQIHENVHVELLGISITVLFITNANEYTKRRLEIERLILQMGSPDNSFAREAVRQLRANLFLFLGYAQDASLSNANLESADLSYADLQRTNMDGATLFQGKIMHADLSRCSIENTNLGLANLSDTSLRNSTFEPMRLDGAVIIGADMTGASMSDVTVLQSAKTLRGTILPDGTKLSEDNWQEELNDWITKKDKEYWGEIEKKEGCY